MTLLTIVQDAARGIGLPVPSTVIGNNDDNVARLLRFVTQEGQELVDGFDWAVLQKERNFSAVAQAVQTNALPTDFKRFIDHTFFNRTRKREVIGPLTPQEWQQQVSLTATVVVDAFRVRGADILVVPNPQAGDTMAFEYVSKYWIDTDPGNGTADAESFSSNADVPVLDEALLTLGAIWRYKASKGFDYAEEFRSNEIKRARLKGDDGGGRMMDLSNSSLRRRALVPQIQEGSWNL